MYIAALAFLLSFHSTLSHLCEREGKFIELNIIRQKLVELSNRIYEYLLAGIAIKNHLQLCRTVMPLL